MSLFIKKKLISIACDLCEISLLYEISKAKHELLILPAQSKKKKKGRSDVEKFKQSLFSSISFAFSG